MNPLIYNIKIKWLKVRHLLYPKLINPWAYDTNHDIKNSLLIIGSPRSGTTFVMESINQNNDFRLIFEPFEPEYTPEWSAFSKRQYLHPQTITNKEIKIIANILTGKYHNSWIDRYNRKLKCDKRIIKAVRANLLVPAIRSIYPNLPIIYIIRNVYDVIHSKMKMNFDDELDFILYNDLFIKTYYPNVDFSIFDLKSPFSRHALTWSLENDFLLRHKESFSLILLDYDSINNKSVSFDPSQSKIIINNLPFPPSASSSFKKIKEFSNVQKKEIHGVVKNFYHVHTFMSKVWNN